MQKVINESPFILTRIFYIQSGKSQEEILSANIEFGSWFVSYNTTIKPNTMKKTMAYNILILVLYYVLIFLIF